MRLQLVELERQLVLLEQQRLVQRQQQEQQLHSYQKHILKKQFHKSCNLMLFRMSCILKKQFRKSCMKKQFRKGCSCCKKEQQNSCYMGCMKQVVGSMSVGKIADMAAGSMFWLFVIYGLCRNDDQLLLW